MSLTTIVAIAAASSMMLLLSGGVGVVSAASSRCCMPESFTSTESWETTYVDFSQDKAITYYNMNMTNVRGSNKYIFYDFAIGEKYHRFEDDSCIVVRTGKQILPQCIPSDAKLFRNTTHVFEVESGDSSISVSVDFKTCHPYWFMVDLSPDSSSHANYNKINLDFFNVKEGLVDPKAFDVKVSDCSRDNPVIG